MYGSTCNIWLHVESTRRYYYVVVLLASRPTYVGTCCNVPTGRIPRVYLKMLRTVDLVYHGIAVEIHVK